MVYIHFLFLYVPLFLKEYVLFTDISYVLCLPFIRSAGCSKDRGEGKVPLRYHRVNNFSLTEANLV